MPWDKDDRNLLNPLMSERFGYRHARLVKCTFSIHTGIIGWKKGSGGCQLGGIGAFAVSVA